MPENQPMTLSDFFKCSYDDSADFMEAETQNCFYDELAKHGFVARNQDEAEKLLKIAEMIQTREESQASDASLIKQAFDRMAGTPANNNKTAMAARRQQEWQSEMAKASQDALDPQVAALAMVLIEGRNLVAA